MRSLATPSKNYFGLNQKKVRLLMKAELMPESYKVWRKSVEKFFVGHGV
jgi:uncharacterized protein (TIGR03643 family)